jgi:hypothetical protein
MVILHDATLDRVTNCKGSVSSWLWSAIRDKCRTDVGGQPLMRLIDLLQYGDTVGKSLTLEIRRCSRTPLWSTILPGSRNGATLQIDRHSDLQEHYRSLPDGLDWPSSMMLG